MRVHNGFLVVLMALIMSLMGVVHLEAAVAQQTDGGQQSDGGAPPHDDGGPPVEEYGSEDTSGDGGGLGGALLLIVALVIIDRVWRVHSRATRRPKVSTSTRHVAHRSHTVSQDRHVESMLRRGDITRDEINYMSGPEFEKFMANFLRRQGYAVEETPLSGDQGVDLILPNFDGKRVVVQLKRYTRPVGNVAVQATFAGMAHYRAEEGWIITTSTFTKSARELARSTRVRLIDGKELADWLEDVRE